MAKPSTAARVAAPRCPGRARRSATISARSSAAAASCSGAKPGRALAPPCQARARSVISSNCGSTGGAK